MSTETTGRDDLSELAAFLNEVRTVWRAADQPQRDRIRRGVMVVLRGCRAPAEPLAGRPEPLQITDDGWFTERAGEFELMGRDQLLGEALTRDISRRLAKAKYLARSGGKMIRADDLKVIVDDCVTCDGPGDLVRGGYVSCRACDDAAAARKPRAGSGPLPPLQGRTNAI